MTTTAPRLTNGLLFLSIGVIHNLCGIAVGLGAPGITPAALGGRRLLVEMFSQGLFGAVEPDPWRMILFWFLFFGLLAMMLGWVLHRVERAGHAVPRVVAWHMGALALAGVLLIPASGFWLVLPVAWRIWRQAPRERAPAVARLEEARG